MMLTTRTVRTPMLARGSARVLAPRRATVCASADFVHALAPLFSLAEAAPATNAAGAAIGSVDAPIEVVIGGAIFVTLVSTALVPIYLGRGQEAADQIFDAESGKQPQVGKVKTPKTPKKK
ncbi:hypothetical protein FOA52_009951 [Chlamydomonas sp. UWO 241]|nr:hypothetical protein FOA52_009951 [Chlamydomonas sp. UWO 241]